MKLRERNFLSVVLLLSTPFAFAGDTPTESLVTVPDQDATRAEVNYDLQSGSPRFGDYDLEVESTKAGKKIFGFSFTNRGGNTVLPTPSDPLGGGPSRDWELHFSDRATQDIHLEIVDQPNGYTSQLMFSAFYFFPRNNLPAIQWPDKESGSREFTVVLPTGENVTYDQKSKIVTGGALKEIGEVDLNPDKTVRKFAGIGYTGSGIMLRIDRQGGLPQTGATAVVVQGKKSCKIAATKLFNRTESQNPVFLFKTDAEFKPFLKKACGFTF